MAGRPSSSPAAASSMDPVHTAAIVDPAAKRSAISAGSTPRPASAQAPRSLRLVQPPPGTTSTPGAAPGSRAASPVPCAVRTSRGPPSATSATSNPSAARGDSGPNTSRSSTPSNTRISTSMAAHWRTGNLGATGRIAILTEDPAMAHKLTILALDAVVPLDLAIAAQVMGYPMAPYDVTICGVRPGQVTTTSGYATAVKHGLRALAAADTVMIPGFDPHNRALPPAVLAALRRAYRRGARMVSICTGAFALAQAGILDSRRAATHWRHAGELAESFPAVTVDADVLYVDQGQVLTSAGVAAGIDLCLHLIRADHGTRAANAVARQVVIAPHRDGGQAQYIRQPIQAEA